MGEAWEHLILPCPSSFGTTTMEVEGVWLRSCALAPGMVFKWRYLFNRIHSVMSCCPCPPWTQLSSLTLANEVIQAAHSPSFCPSQQISEQDPATREDWDTIGATMQGPRRPEGVASLGHIAGASWSKGCRRGESDRCGPRSPPECQESAETKQAVECAGGATWWLP